MNEPGDPPTGRPCLNSPMPIQRNDFGSTALECDDWLLSIHRPNLSNKEEVLQQLMDIVPASVTLTDPSQEQLASRPSSAFHRSKSTLA
jgi:hypothetical protein